MAPSVLPPSEEIPKNRHTTCGGLLEKIMKTCGNRLQGLGLQGLLDQVVWTGTRLIKGPHCEKLQKADFRHYSTYAMGSSNAYELAKFWARVVP